MLMARTNLPFSNYESTRLLTDSQRRVNVYSNSQGGVRQFPGLVEFSSFVAPVYDSKFLDVSAKSTVNDVIFNADDTVAYVFDSSVTHVDEWALSTAGDISSGTFTQSITLTSYPDSAPGHGTFADSGNKLYVSDNTTRKVYQYNLSTAYDVSTLAWQNKTLDASTEVTPTGSPVEVSTDGGKVFVGATVGVGKVFQYNLTTPFELDTGSYSTISVDFSGDLSLMTAFRFNADGTNITLADATSDDLTQYSMSTGFDLETISSALVVFSISSQSGDVRGFNWGNDGSKLYITDVGSPDSIFQYTTAGYALYDSSSLSAGATAAIVMQGVPFAVIGGSLYSFTSVGAPTLIGAMAAATGIATDGTNIIVTTGGQPFRYSASTGITSLTDSDLKAAFTVAYLDRRFIFEQPGGEWVVTALDDPTSIDALDQAEAEAFGDDLLSVFTHNQLAYLNGDRTIEVWFTSGVSRPPLDRQVVIQRGVIGRQAMDSIDNTIYFLDHDRRPNQMTGLEYRAIYTPAIGKEFDSYSTVDDCIVNCYTIKHENFAEFFFPTEAKTWTYHELSKQWTKRENTANAAFPVSVYIEAYNLLLGVDRTNGTVYKFVQTTYQDDGSNITRTIDSEVISSVLFEVPGQDLNLNEVSVTFDSSTAATVSVSLSTNMTSFGTARDMTLVAGINRVSLYRWGKIREGILRFTTTTNAKIDIIDTAIEVDILRA